MLLNLASLVARIYKARYFPTSSFLDAHLKANPSFIWRSIMEAQEVIRMGVIWRVGKGNQVNIWLDPWLPA